MAWLILNSMVGTEFGTRDKLTELGLESIAQSTSDG
jgi:hypothetical protein